MLHGVSGVIKCGYRTKNVVIDVQGVKSQISFVTVANITYNIILGLDWFVKTGAGIYPKHKELVFKRHCNTIEQDYSKVCLVTELSEEKDIQNSDDWSFESNNRRTFQLVIELDLILLFYSIRENNVCKKLLAGATISFVSISSFVYDFYTQI
jgi:hypothetical protein